MWRAYVDEPESNRRLDPDTYLLAGAVLDEEACGPTREALRALRFPGARKLRWYDEPEYLEPLASVVEIHDIGPLRAASPGPRPTRTFPGSLPTAPQSGGNYDQGCSTAPTLSSEHAPDQAF
ncbi:MAG: hypothetical protein ACRDN9_19980 [Streptosporangiaceae bacterium]